MAGLTQVEVAKAVGTSQPNYQRWESEKSEVPASKVKKLTRVLRTTEDEVRGNPAPFDLFGVDDSIVDSRTYFGEIAFHFVGPGKPLMFSVTEEERTRVLRQMNSDSPFIETRSLDNRIVFVRRAAIADLYTSSEAYDSYGPEQYFDHVGVIPETDYWEIVEQIEEVEGKFCVYEAPDGVDEKRVDEVFEEVTLSDERLDELIRDGKVNAEQREQVKEEAAQETRTRIQHARAVVWQFTNGVIRSEDVVEDEALVYGFANMEDEADLGDTAIYIPFEGYHRSVHINKEAIDYISIPAHKFDAAMLEVVASELDD